MKNQPIDKVFWVDRELLFANNYNPNHVSPREMDLLRTSLIDDGWTSAIVVTEKNDEGMYEIVDGFHRWTLAEEPQIAEQTDGKIPIVILEGKTDFQRMASTIRHNRARGVHHVIGMSDIVALAVQMGISQEEVMAKLGMEQEEVERLLDKGNMRKRGSKPEFNKGWVPGK